MNRGAILALATRALLAGPGLADASHAACPPPEPVLVGVRSSTRVQLEQLDSEDTRSETPFAHVPGRTLGYEVHGLFRVTGPVAEALREAFGRRDSYACTPQVPASAFSTPEGLPIGLHFAGGRGAVGVVLHLPEGEVEIQLEGGERMSAPLSRVGQRRWELALTLLARETRTSPREFYEQMLPPARVPSSTAPPADTSSAPRDDSPPER